MHDYTDTVYSPDHDVQLSVDITALVKSMHGSCDAEL